MSTEIFQSLVQLYSDVYGNKNTYVNLDTFTTLEEDYTVWVFKSKNPYKYLNDECAIIVNFEPVSHHVLTVMVKFDDEVTAFWVSPEDANQFQDEINYFSHAIKNDVNAVIDVGRRGFFYTGEDMEQDLNDDEPNENGIVNIPLNLTDSELALIARAAHALDITINEFMNRAVKDILEEMNYNYENL